MAKIQMIVDGEIFPSKKKLIERCQKILHGYKVKETLPENDTRFLNSLINNYHPESELKIGCGVKRMWIDSNEYGGIGFYLERFDGSSTDWSFMKSINNPSKWHDFRAACRNAIMDQTIEYKMKRFEEERYIECCLTGEQLFVDTAHTDHEPPRTFDALLKVFLQKSKIDYNTIQIDPTYDNKVGCWLSDVNFSKRWFDFHKLNAKFRLTSRTGNLSHSKIEMNNIIAN